MVDKTLIFGYASIVGTNRNQIDFGNTYHSGVPRTNQTIQMACKNTPS